MVLGIKNEKRTENRKETGIKVKSTRMSLALCL